MWIARLGSMCTYGEACVRALYASFACMHAYMCACLHLHAGIMRVLEHACMRALCESCVLIGKLTCMLMCSLCLHACFHVCMLACRHYGLTKHVYWLELITIIPVKINLVWF